jgi:hypothetical protein
MADVPKEELLSRLRNRLFSSNKSVVQNNFRGELVEEIISSILAKEYGGDWVHCSGDWGAWDFQKDDNLFIQVKQAAARQSWDDPESDAPSSGRGVFSIACNTGSYGRAKWLSFDGKEGRPKAGRIAQIYIFGWHNDRKATADHFDLKKWKFFIALSWRLPNKNTITVKQLEDLVQVKEAWSCSLDQLSSIVRLASEECKNAPDLNWRSEVLKSLTDG